jgi:hypothetical protein
MRLFLREYNFENAITQKISVLVHFLILGKVLRILFHILKHFIVLRAIHILIHPAERDVLFEWLNSCDLQTKTSTTTAEHSDRHKAIVRKPLTTRLYVYHIFLMTDGALR